MNTVFVIVWDNLVEGQWVEDVNYRIYASCSSEIQAKAYCDARNKEIEEQISKELDEGHPPSHEYHGKYSYIEVPFNPPV